MRICICCVVLGLSCAACATSADRCQGSLQQINAPAALNAPAKRSSPAPDGSPP